MLAEVWRCSDSGLFHRVPARPPELAPSCALTIELADQYKYLLRLLAEPA